MIPGRLSHRYEFIPGPSCGSADWCVLIPSQNSRWWSRTGTSSPRSAVLNRDSLVGDRESKKNKQAERACEAWITYY